MAVAQSEHPQPQDLSPYKFLSPYEMEDQDIFFGRKRETKILFSDIAVNRLVILFAKTGTGKTSLINAGVRPLLEERGYATFFVRVKKKPVKSAREVILKSGGSLRWKGRSLADRLENVANQLRKPIVLFFDQFEEFFIYAPKENPQRARKYISAFVSNIARLVLDPRSRVHIVFSMREEWFVEMDVFRDEIPKIFHNESNLRLRWFDREQARDAIKLPAEVAEVLVEDDLVEKIVKDLSVNGEIEPAQLQIVCDTLWQKTEGKHVISLADYEGLGKWGGGPVSQQILYKRLEDQFKALDTERELQLLYVLLPKLATPWKTKYVRDLIGLVNELVKDLQVALSDPASPLREVLHSDEEINDQVEALKAGPGALDPLIARLEHARFIRRSFRDGLDVIELLHDYLVESLGVLRSKVKAIWPGRLLEEGMRRYESTGELIPADALEKITASVDVLDLTPEQSRALFDSALEHGQHMKEWFGLLSEAGAEGIFRKRLGNIAGSSNAIDFLVELHTPYAFNLLDETLAREEVAAYVVEVLCYRETPEAVRFLSRALQHPGLEQKAREALERMGKSTRHPEVADLSAKALEQFKVEIKVKTVWPVEALRGPTILRTQDDAASYDADAAKYLQPHYKTAARFITEGRVVFFLGAGANFSGPYGSGWDEARRLPFAAELAEYFAKKFDYPLSDSRHLSVPHIAQYITIMFGKAALYDELHRLFDADYPLTHTHRFLAGLPALMREQWRTSAGQVIMTSNYDDLLERAFTEAGEPFDLVTYVADGQGSGKFSHQPPGEEPRLIEVPNRYRDVRHEERPVILKISGGVDRKNPGRDSYVITEDDFIEQLVRTDISSSIPVSLSAKLRRSHFLFLGHSLLDWNVRVTLRRIWGEQFRGYKSWSVQLHPDRIEQELWRKRDVDILDASLDSYITALSEHMKSGGSDFRGGLS